MRIIRPVPLLDTDVPYLPVTVLLYGTYPELTYGRVYAYTVLSEILSSLLAQSR